MAYALRTLCLPRGKLGLECNVVPGFLSLTAHLVASATAPLWRVYRGAVSAPGREPVDGPQCAQQLLTGRTDARTGGGTLAPGPGVSLSLSLSRSFISGKFSTLRFPFHLRRKGEEEKKKKSRLTSHDCVSVPTK